MLTAYDWSNQNTHMSPRSSPKFQNGNKLGPCEHKNWLDNVIEKMSGRKTNTQSLSGSRSKIIAIPVK